MTSFENAAKRRHALGYSIATSGACYCLSTAIVVLGVMLGERNLSPAPAVRPPGAAQVDSFANWDGLWYVRIVEHGYDYDPSTHSSVAFFPAYPLLGNWVRAASAMSASAALLMLSHVSLAAAAGVLSIYASHAQTESSEEVIWGGLSFAPLWLAFWPTGVFLRMTYSESLFLLLVLLCMLGIQRRWPLWLGALIAGAAMATRSVGIALLLPLAWDWWRRSGGPLRFGLKAALFGPLACWGLIAYMLYLYVAFGDPFVFVKTQQHWAMRPDLPWPGKLRELLTLEPVWSLYVPSSPAYWAKHDSLVSSAFSLQFWNPIYFIACALLVVWGTYKHWLTAPEILLSAGMLAIPYLTQSYRMMMLGHGRFTCVVFPMYLVLGRGLRYFPPTVSAVICVLIGVQLFYWSALFAAWYRVF